MGYRRPEPLRSDHRLDDFQCEEPALTDWLQRFARIAQASEASRVYVVTTDEQPLDVVGYHALAASSVRPEDATPRILLGQPQRQRVPALLLARLARDERHRAKGMGPSLLQDALLRAVQAADVIGARTFLVHAKNERAKEFYLKYGFEPSPTDPLHLMMLMKDIRAFLRR